MLIFPKTKPIRTDSMLLCNYRPEILAYFVSTLTQLKCDELSHDENRVFSTPVDLLFTIIVHRENMYVEILICL
jgi:hypothetical protein